MRAQGFEKYIGLKYPEAKETNLYFLSWFENLQYALTHNLSMYVAGWTDPEVKASLGASFTMTNHAVYFRSSVLRFLLTPFKRFFESDTKKLSTR